MTQSTLTRPGGLGGYGLMACGEKKSCFGTESRIELKPVGKFSHSAECRYLHKEKGPLKSASQGLLKDPYSGPSRFRRVPWFLNHLPATQEKTSIFDFTPLSPLSNFAAFGDPLTVKYIEMIHADFFYLFIY